MRRVGNDLPVRRVVGRSQARHHPVVVFLWDRIKFVAVTSGALDRQRKQTRRYDVQRVVNRGVVIPRDVVFHALAGKVGSGAQESGRDEFVANFGREPLGVAPVDLLITTDLFVDKLVVRLVGIE